MGETKASTESDEIIMSKTMSNSNNNNNKTSGNEQDEIITVDQLQSLVKQRIDLEEELQTLRDYLIKGGGSLFGLNGSFVDKEGYPVILVMNDTNQQDTYLARCFYRLDYIWSPHLDIIIEVKKARARIACIQTDYKILMKSIEDGMLKLHAQNKPQQQTVPKPSSISTPTTSSSLTKESSIQSPAANPSSASAVGSALAPATATLATPVKNEEPFMDKGYNRMDLEIKIALDHHARKILTTEALAFLVELERKFRSARTVLLAKRQERQADLNRGIFPDFLKNTENVRKADWKCAAMPRDIMDRRVEITGPPERKMVINALNSGAKVFMADFEDANCPTWYNSIHGQINMIDINNRTISYKAPDGREYKLKPEVATLFVRPRGWHLDEEHVYIDGMPMSGSLFDFGLYFFHNYRIAMNRGSAPYFYLPKLESHLEARLWNEVFNFSQHYVGIPIGTIKATVLIETVLASFEMDEILYELREHSAGLNCGRWDYIFSIIKKFQQHPQFVLPDRAKVTMTSPFMESYVKLLIYTCHRRGVHAMGGMAAQIPIKDNKQANDVALEKVKADKLREVMFGHDGTWVAHPALIPTALEQFNLHMKTPNQIHIIPPNPSFTAKDILSIPEIKSDDISEEGLKGNIIVGVEYLDAWLNGNGCVPINHLMEDAATAEISRSQIWQWIKHKSKLSNGKVITLEYFNQILKELQPVLENRNKKSTTLKDSIPMFQSLIASPTFVDFLTPTAYQYVIRRERTAFNPKL
ncbi:malate synthase [Cavenderia fasciculata]|uniref:Malate synthase n=1 Tax=Cavenderia fasciculata TaxID=261658 RepID=F4PUW7_CACFS|nr:malate synthase [Cavenderia fasciculata]EGG21929.1 malate synthase [Cavenderia fasciculata]|eukprot:XP_004359780.1 malate synthase [Cavenderia fasciculata]